MPIVKQYSCRICPKEETKHFRRPHSTTASQEMPSPLYQEVLKEWEWSMATQATGSFCRVCHTFLGMFFFSP